jgi:hypothetical protein
MFDLEKSIADWRKQMLAAGIKAPVPLEELEIHLREEIELQMQSGLSEREIFNSSIQKIGQAKSLKMEFRKIDAQNWSRSLAWTAWILFAVSFFLPAHQYAGMGWRCAYMSAHGFVDPEFWHGKFSDDYLLTLLTLANLLMIGSPFWLFRYAQKAVLKKWFDISTFAALILVWSYILLWLTHSDRSELRIGCYVWGSSFLLLSLSTLKACHHKSRTVRIKAN